MFQRTAVSRSQVAEDKYTDRKNQVHLVTHSVRTPAFSQNEASDRLYVIFTQEEKTKDHPLVQGKERGRR